MMLFLKPVIGLAGGLGLFIYGMQLCFEGLQKVAAHRLKQWLHRLTKNPVMGALIGALIALALQSSSATSALVVGFVSTKMMTLAQALGVLLGSSFGSSLTAQLIAYQITDLALVLLFVGAVLYLFAKRSQRRNLGQALLGFGLIFYGMFVMSSAMAPVRNYPTVVQAFVRMEHYPLLAFLVAMVCTALLQSSSVVLALLMSLAVQGLIGSLAIIPLVLGVHLGGTITAFLSSLGTPELDAKRAAVANFIFKFVNGLVFLPLYRPLSVWLIGNSTELSYKIANSYTFFAVAMLVFLPFTKQLAQWVEWLVPEAKGGTAKAVYLDKSVLAIPELAVDQARHQTLEMGRIVEEEMLSQVIPLLHDRNFDSLDRLAEVEKDIDRLYLEISKYVTQLGNGRLQEDIMNKCVQILYVANDLEHVGDLMVTIIKSTRKLMTEDLEFSKEGMGEIETIFTKAYKNFQLVLTAFENMDTDLATRVIKEHPVMLRLEKQLRYSHFDRMQCGNAKTFATSAIHLDLIEAVLRIDSHTVNIAQCILGIV
ncbi:MAG TPA: Na/Pi cotransporter family protein [Bacillota bacterium]